MEDKNELNDIILNKGNSASSNKKIVLAVATLGVILIIVVMLMNSLSSNGTDNLPQAVLPPEPETKSVNINSDEPLFEDVQIVEEDTTSDEENLDKIAQKLKQESQEELIEEEKVVVTPKPTPKKKIVKKKVYTPKTPVNTKITQTGHYYIQVGSFSKYKPNKKFLKSITNLGFQYRYHKVNNLNKVLVGPFKSSTQAKNARRKIRAKIEPGAFLVKL